MFNFNLVAMVTAVVTASCIVGLLFALSPRDTLQGFREFWDMGVFRRLWRSIGKLSLKRVLVMSYLAAPILALGIRSAGYFTIGHFVFIPLVAGYLLGGVIPLLVMFYRDAFGPGPRQQWRRFLAANRRKNVWPE